MLWFFTNQEIGGKTRTDYKRSTAYIKYIFSLGTCAENLWGRNHMASFQKSSIIQ